MNWPAFRLLGSTAGVGGGAAGASFTAAATGAAALPASDADRLIIFGSAAILSKMLLLVSMSCSGLITRLPFFRSVGTTASAGAVAATGAGSVTSGVPLISLNRF